MMSANVLELGIRELYEREVFLWPPRTGDRCWRKCNKQTLYVSSLPECEVWETEHFQLWPPLLKETHSLTFYYLILSKPQYKSTGRHVNQEDKTRAHFLFSRLVSPSADREAQLVCLWFQAAKLESRNPNSNVQIVLSCASFSHSHANIQTFARLVTNITGSWWNQEIENLTHHRQREKERVKNDLTTVFGNWVCVHLWWTELRVETESSECVCTQELVIPFHEWLKEENIGCRANTSSRISSCCWFCWWVHPLLMMMQ